MNQTDVVMIFEDPNGPVEAFSWGKFIIKGKEHSKTESGKKGKGKDIRLMGKDVSKWKERSGHVLDEDMITGVFDKDIETLVIGTGVNGMVECPENVIKFIKKRGIKNVLLLITPEACKTYNRLYHEKIKVALLAHGTC